MKKKVLTILFVTMLLFVTGAVSAQENINLRLPSSVFYYSQVSGNEVTFSWKLLRDIGDAYDGQTAYEMMEWGCSQYPDHLQIMRFGTDFGDENYLHGYIKIVYKYTEPCVMTIEGLENFGGTVVLNLHGFPLNSYQPSSAYLLECPQ